MDQEPVGAWEKLPEVIINRQYVRCMDRLLQSVPPSARSRLFVPVLSGSVAIGVGAASFHAVLVNGAPPTPEERESHRREALEGIRASRECLGRIRDIPGADPAELLVAGELLDRMEEMLRGARPWGVA